MTTKRVHNLRIWGLALGYFAAYIPYSAVVKSMTSGLIPGHAQVSGFEILPATLVSTAVTMLAIITAAGWWRTLRTRRILGLNIPTPGGWTSLSGLGTAIIIATTTLAYSFNGVSVVLALVLMRAGVLIIAPVVDSVCRRRVRWFSWSALAFSLVAIAVVTASARRYDITLAAGLNLAAYLSGYMVRLPCMTRLAKCEDKAITRRYFVEEMLVATVTMVAIAGLMAVGGGSGPMLELRRGFTVFMWSGSVGPAFLAGFSYACLYYFGTLIYLDRRENTFCITLNRGASLLSGIVSSFGLAAIAGAALPRGTEFVASGFILMALLFLSPLHHLRLQIRRVEDALSESQLAPLAFGPDRTDQTMANRGGKATG